MIRRLMRLKILDNNRRMSFNIYVREEDTKLPVSKEKLENIAAYTFQLTGKGEGDISLVVCNDKFITQLNKKYKKRSSPTDVLSFPMRDGGFFQSKGNILGDIVISADTAKRQAKELGESLEEEFFILFIHGLLHLLGYNHKSQAEEKTMREITQNILTGVQQIL